ncbi:MAG: DUF1080 domain-containing protein [Bacteroidales bacterium]
MKKSVILLGSAMAIALTSGCGSNNKKASEESAPQPQAEAEIAPEEGEIVLFDGESFNGWRGYNRQDVPTAWTIEDGCIKINGSGMGEAGAKDGGDIIFDQKFGNFELTFDWKVDKGSNSGIFYLAQEVPDKPIYYSAPEYQILDNQNHPDARLGIDGNRCSASLYDMIPAKPQNSKPYGEWNTGKILVYKGTVVHFQNGEQMLEYHLWTPEWQEMLDKCKFSQDKNPVAYDLLINCGGDEKAGYIGLQDHGDNVWYRNIKVKKLD